MSKHSSSDSPPSPPRRKSGHVLDLQHFFKLVAHNDISCSELRSRTVADCTGAFVVAAKQLLDSCFIGGTTLCTHACSSWATTVFSSLHMWKRAWFRPSFAKILDPPLVYTGSLNVLLYGPLYIRKHNFVCRACGSLSITSRITPTHPKSFALVLVPT